MRPSTCSGGGGARRRIAPKNCVDWRRVARLDRELAAILDPLVAERPAEAAHVAHPLPRQEGGAAVEGALGVGADPELLEGLHPQVLLADEAERHVDPVHRHPVDVLLPVAPRHEGERVAVRADVHVVAPRKLARDDLRRRRQRQRQVLGGQLVLGVRVPVHRRVQVVVEVPVERRR
jgi:hypothetical protein